MARFLLLSSLLLSTLIQSAPQSLDALGTSALPTNLFSSKNSPSTTYSVVITLNDDAPKDDLTDRLTDLIDSSTAKNNYKADFDGTVVNGLAGDFTAKILNTIKDEFGDLVKAIEPDYTMTVSLGKNARKGRFTPPAPSPAPSTPAPVTKQDPPANWGQTRIVQNSFNASQPFIFPTVAGDGVDVYHIDTGIWPDHPDFDHTRVKMEKVLVAQEPPVDFSGHGTHTAGIIVGQKYGIAKKARLHSIKALNRFGQGQMSDILTAIQYAAQQHLLKGWNAKSILTMSIGGPQSIAVNTAINAAYAAGMFIVAASGNDGKDGCTVSPGSAAGAYAVGAVDQTDTMPPWSNFGTCTNIYAPGVDIRSTWIPVVPQGSVAPPGWLDFPVVYLSGTSMAAPYVTGVAALIMSTSTFSDNRSVKRMLDRMSIGGRIKGQPQGSVNRLLNMQLLLQNYYNDRMKAHGLARALTKLPNKVMSWADLLAAAAKLPVFKPGVTVLPPVPPLPGQAAATATSFSVTSVSSSNPSTGNGDDDHKGGASNASDVAKAKANDNSAVARSANSSAAADDDDDDDDGSDGSAGDDSVGADPSSTPTSGSAGPLDTVFNTVVSGPATT